MIDWEAVIEGLRDYKQAALCRMVRCDTQEDYDQVLRLGYTPVDEAKIDFPRFAYKRKEATNA